MNSAKSEVHREEILLTGMLGEFREALREEYEEISQKERNSSIKLVEGSRMGKVGDCFQYSFKLEKVLILAEDTPGHLKLQGFTGVDVNVQTVNGMSIVLNVPMDIGENIREARLQSNFSELVLKLIKRIEQMKDISNPAADRMLGKVSISGKPVHIEASLNPQQSNALNSCLGCDTTFIWGPPGTGKTRTIGAIGYNLYKQKRSLLLVSHTNLAVDQAIIQIADNINDPDVFKHGGILRIGEPGDKRFTGDKYKDILFKTHVEKRKGDLLKQEEAYRSDVRVLEQEIEERSRIIAVCQWAKNGLTEISELNSRVESVNSLEAKLIRNSSLQRDLLIQSATWSKDKDAAEKAKDALIRISEIEREITEINRRLNMGKANLDSSTKRLADAQRILSESIPMKFLERLFKRYPRPKKQERVIRNIQDHLKSVEEKLIFDQNELNKRIKEKNEKSIIGEEFRKIYLLSPYDILDRILRGSLCLKELEPEIKRESQQFSNENSALQTLFKERLHLLRTWGIIQEGYSENDERREIIGKINKAHQKVRAEFPNPDFTKLTREKDALIDEKSVLEAKLKVLQEELNRIEAETIQKAMVAATTLTKIFLKDTMMIQKFDTVIIDEATMASIPSLWVAASLAKKNIIVVGDFLQLAPIVQSNKKMARKWLARDIFEVAGRGCIEDSGGKRADLCVQHRMHPQISKISSLLIYKGKLQDGKGMDTVGEDTLALWYRSDWGFDHPVTLIDTGVLDAYVTESEESKLNFISASLCVNLAHQILKKERMKPEDGEKKRILIVCPYKPHVKLLNILIKEHGLEEEVTAGTAHSFQGSEGDVVIMDLVNDEPGRYAGMFMEANDSTNIRLLNVALTRAKRRLYIVGDFEFIKKHGAKSFLGKELVPFLLSNYPRYGADKVATESFSGLAADMNFRFSGRSIEAQSNRMIVNQDKFYPVFFSDLSQSKETVIIFSPFMGKERLSYLEIPFKRAVERGISIYVVTKNREERNAKLIEEYNRLEKMLRDWGITIIYRRGMHEKIIFIDSEIIWSGSLNSLSFAGSQEIMERRKNKTIFGEYEKTLGVRDLIISGNSKNHF